MKQNFERHLLASPTIGPLSSDVYSKCMERSQSYVPSYERTEAETYEDEHMDRPTEQGYIVRISPHKSTEQGKYRYEEFDLDQIQTNGRNSHENELSGTEGLLMMLPMQSSNTKKKESETKVVTIKDIRLICRRYMERNLKHGVNRSVTKKDVQLIRKRFEDKKGSNSGRRKGRYVTSISLPKRKPVRKRQQKDEEYQNDLSLKSNTRDVAHNVMLGEKCIPKTEHDNTREEICFIRNEDYFTKNEKLFVSGRSHFAPGMENHCIEDKDSLTVDENYFKRGEDFTDENCFKQNVNESKGGGNRFKREEFISKIDEYFAEKETVLMEEERVPYAGHVNCFITEEKTEKEGSNNAALEYYSTTTSNRNIPCEYMNSRNGSGLSASGLSHEYDRMDRTPKENGYENYFPKGYIVTTGLHKERDHDIVQVYEEERKEGGYFKREEEDGEERYERKEGWEHVCENSFGKNCEQRECHYNCEREERECRPVNCFHLSYEEKEKNGSHYDHGDYVYDYKETEESESEYSFEDVYDHKEARTYESEDLFQQIQGDRGEPGESEFEYPEQVYEYKGETDAEYDSTFEQSYEPSEWDYTFEEESESEAENSFEHVRIRNEVCQCEGENYPEQECKRDKINENVCEGTFDNAYPTQVERGNGCTNFLERGYSIRKCTGYKETKGSPKHFTENRDVNSANFPSFKGEQWYDNCTYYKQRNSIHNTSDRKTVLPNNRKEGYSITLPSRSTVLKRTFPKSNFL